MCFRESTLECDVFEICYECVQVSVKYNVKESAFERVHELRIILIQSRSQHACCCQHETKERGRECHKSSEAQWYDTKSRNRSGTFNSKHGNPSRQLSPAPTHPVPFSCPPPSRRPLDCLPSPPTQGAPFPPTRRGSARRRGCGSERPSPMSCVAQP